MRLIFYLRYFRQNALAILLIIGSLLVILFNESIAYYQKSWQWNKLQCDSEECTRILLVADPQILGETFDKNFYNTLAIHDSDRFLSKTFNIALRHCKPHVIVFMGDLMDEGSVAKIEEFQRYVNRFKTVFYVLNDNVMLMHISGDNDVGGENSGDTVTSEKVNRFKNAFNEQGYIDVRNRLRIFNVNQFTHFLPNVTKEETPTTNNTYYYNRIVVTHISLLSFPGLSTERVKNKIQPNVIFSAHQHVSRIITYPPIHIEHFNKDNSIRTFHFTAMKSNHYLKVMIPTCSYRMGSTEIGYGFALIENNRLQYTVLWLPNRFTYLYAYLAWICICILFSIIYSIIRKCCLNKRAKLDYHHSRIHP